MHFFWDESLVFTPFSKVSLSQKCKECLFLCFLTFLADQLGFILFLVVGAGRSGPAGTSKCSPRSAGSVPESCGPGGWTQLEEGCAEPNEVKGGLEVGGGLLGTGVRDRSAPPSTGGWGRAGHPLAQVDRAGLPMFCRLP